jgi:hypothetical protein
MTKTTLHSLAALALVLIFSSPVYSMEEPKFEQPLLITSAGQSAEVQLVAILAKRSDLDYILVKSASPGDLDDAKTLVLSLGASLKGLGAAGLDVQQEKDRVAVLIEAARSRNIPIVCLHMGGKDRRGGQSDDFISTFLPYARFAIIVKSGNQDGLFTRICDRHDIPLIEVEKTVNAMEAFKKAFR